MEERPCWGALAGLIRRRYVDSSYLSLVHEPRSLSLQYVLGLGSQGNCSGELEHPTIQGLRADPIGAAIPLVLRVDFSLSPCIVGDRRKLSQPRGDPSKPQLWTEDPGSDMCFDIISPIGTENTAAEKTAKLDPTKRVKLNPGK